MEPVEYELMDAHEEGMWWYRALHARLADALAEVSGTVLDAGCGTGGFLRHLGRARPALSRVGLEYDAHAAARARAKSGAMVVRGSVNALPFDAGRFDAVVSADVLSHRAVVPDAALAELRRVLQPGGRLVVNMPAYQWLHSAHDVKVHNVRRVDAPALRTWLTSAGFEVVRVSYWNGLLLPLLVLNRKLASADAASDVTAYPPWVDTLFHAVTRIERAVPVPAGSSVLAVAVRR